MTLKNFIEISLSAVGKVMYIYGGGWNKEDTGAGTGALTYGIRKEWTQFFKESTPDYNYKNYDVKKDDSLLLKGLDCSAYIGWVIYNLKKDGGSYVTKSGNIGHMLTEKGFGKVIKKEDLTVPLIGDIMFKDGHTYISLGVCGDKSLLIVHSSPCGVQVNGVSDKENSQAEILAQNYMQTKHPEWYNKFSNVKRDISYINEYDCFRWTVLSDKEGFSFLLPDKLLERMI